MIRLFAWPQLSTAAALITAVTVILNPVMPVLPDVTVPAVFPPAGGSRPPVAARSEPPIDAVPPLPALPLASPSITAPSVVFSPARPIPAVVPTVIAAPPIPAKPDVAVPDVAVPTVPPQSLTPVPTAVPVFHVENPLGLAHTGDRPLPVVRQRLAPTVGPKPLPAAAVEPPGAPPPDGGAARSQGRVGLPGPDVAARGHRGPVNPG